MGNLSPTMSRITETLSTVVPQIYKESSVATVELSHLALSTSHWNLSGAVESPLTLLTAAAVELPQFSSSCEAYVATLGKPAHGPRILAVQLSSSCHRQKSLRYDFY